MRSLKMVLIDYPQRLDALNGMCYHPLVLSIERIEENTYGQP
jgi:hypothetical protein